MLKRCSLVVVLASALWASGAAAGEKATWSALVENDYFGSTDKNYTNGVRFGYLSAKGRGENFARRFMRASPEDETRIGFALGQSIFTPQDTEAFEPLPDQHPYAGWLYGEYSVLVERSDDILDMLTISAGVVGPAALGEEVQNSFHRLIDDDRINGWDNQLRNEPGLILAYERRWRPLFRVSRPGIGVDATPNAGVSVGNVLTHGKAGLTLRIGRNLQGNYGPPRIRPSLAGAGYYRGVDTASWYLFAGAEGRAVARNIFLDGNTWRDSLSLEKRHFVADFQAGVVIQVKSLQIAYTYVWRTKEFVNQGARHEFGALSLSAKF
ncbi:lipid A deacylase LpxR family protein [Hyphococcus luteus]|uniref:DUF2219 domain-containing protein n=1 Tax=Hyphococcus luteus TaxID=2058213 RepID=A0A2S7K2E3_9PROT|nr:lipid A deacylase LpxR family protein [Marinicaulis flavus]PQA86653.1 DUF2219 domain-containing protein [Marinicaulis flavus]